jgi:glycosyltransferase involved in cell wall biosynthesis
MTEWLLASGDFVPAGGMDTANHALASYLARRDGANVHLVAHRVAPDLSGHASVRVHRVPRPFGMHTLGEPLLTHLGHRHARAVRRRGGHVVANGGNVNAGDVCWVHYVHAAYEPSAAGALNSAIVSARHRHYVAAERRALTGARLIICNSTRTMTDVVHGVGVHPSRLRRVYYGIDSARFHPSRDSARAKTALGVDARIPVVLFVGALGDRRKGFDTLFAAWCELCRTAEWDALLLVAGSGAELPAWRARTARHAAIANRIRFLGYRDDVPALLTAADLLVHPAKYEAYGLAVHEALCCGIPALVSSTAGIAERYPDDLRPLLIDDVDSASELTARLRAWRDGKDGFHARAEKFSAVLSARTWDDMSRDIVDLIGP